MKKGIMLGVICIGLLVSGCATKGQTGALVGTGVGAGAGYLIGGGTGALIGAGVGAVGGGLIGSSLDQRDQDNLQRQSSSTYKRADNGEQLSINDVIAMSNAGISDSKIIELLQKTNSRYVLSTNQIDFLRREGVSERVINYMMQT
ncbi:MAG: YMGG-like glycine zipper-containing protein [Simkaniaceae bacterium]|nr:YMGG-like glycine zipper-containing protein [Simkaniaceae bacterium]